MLTDQRAAPRRRAAAVQALSCRTSPRGPRMSAGHLKWLLVLHQCQRVAIAMACRAMRQLRRGDRTLRRAVGAGLLRGILALSI